MLDSKNLIIGRIFDLVYDDSESETPENEESNNQDSENQDSVNKEKEKTPPEKQLIKSGKTFTQDEVNTLLSREKKTYQKNRDVLINELKSIRETANLTENQKQQLEARIEQLQNETLTAQELAKKDRDKLIKEYDKEKKTLIEDRDYWRTSYAEEKIHREIVDAAIEHKAISPTQILNILKPNAKLIEELKDGKPTKKWVSRITFLDKDEKGEPIMLELSVTEAVKRMSEMNEHWNLFNSGVSGGFGGINHPNGSSQRGSKPPKDHNEYMKWRKANISAKG